MKKKLNLVVLIIALLVLSKFWIGVYEHDEFHNERIFVKHRAIWKTYFYSPRGMSDLKLSEMTVEDQAEQKLFDEFVLGKQKL